MHVVAGFQRLLASAICVDRDRSPHHHQILVRHVPVLREYVSFCKAVHMLIGFAGWIAEERYVLAARVVRTACLEFSRERDNLHLICRPRALNYQSGKGKDESHEDGIPATCKFHGASSSVVDHPLAQNL